MVTSRAWMPLLRTGWASIFQPLTGSEERPCRNSSTGTPQSRRAPSAISPAMPAKQSKYAIVMNFETLMDTDDWDDIYLSLSGAPWADSSVIGSWILFRRRRMEAAKAAAPKPLSILTTAMPFAHELSMPSKERE